MTVNQCIKIIREVLPDTASLIGGGHPTGAGIETMAHLPDADFAFRGESEKGLSLLLSKLIKGSKIGFTEIPGLIYKENGKIHENTQDYYQDIDELPLPAWDKIDPGKYRHAPQGGFLSAFPYAPIITSRGCPYRCSYCPVALSSGRKIRYRKLENVFEEIDLLVREYGIRELHIVDDAFTEKKSRAEEFFEILLTKPYKLSLAFPNGLRLDTLDLELLNLMKRAGVYSINVGIESGSQRILNLMQKHLTLELIEDRVKLIKKTGIIVTGFFILGYPGETLEEMKMTRNFAVKIPLDRAQFSNFQVYPGTPVTNELKEKGEISSTDWSSTIFNKISYTPRGVSPAQLKREQKKDFLKFYLRIKIIRHILKNIYSKEHFFFIIRRLYQSFFVK
jgi:radical SAM superfamily enzyme YgiQ (UPF0313 family)